MSGIYANDIAHQMPIVWGQPGGPECRGKVFAVEGDARAGFLLFVITDQDEIAQVSVSDDNVRLDKEILAEARRKAAAEAGKPQILTPQQGMPPQGA